MASQTPDHEKVMYSYKAVTVSKKFLFLNLPEAGFQIYYNGQPLRLITKMSVSEIKDYVQLLNTAFYLGELSKNRRNAN